MNILFANNYYYLRGGSERVMFDEMELLEARGHKVAPFTRHHAQNIPTDYSEYFPPHLDYERIPLARKFSAACQLIYSRKVGKCLQSLMENFQPDLLHGHNIYGRLTTSILDAARARSMPAILTLHDYKLICPSYLMLINGNVCERCKGGGYYHAALNRCHKGSTTASMVYTVEAYVNRLFKKYDTVRQFICPSRFILQQHRDAGLPEHRLTHIPNFIKAEKFNPVYAPGKYILYVGRLSHEKGVTTLLEAVRGLNLTLRIVGDGPLRRDYEKQAQNSGASNIIFEGYRHGEELIQLYQQAAFLVFPSEWYENAPMTILEAFACGKPVIASRIGGITEMVADYETGLTYTPGSTEELRENILSLLQNPERIATMGRNARKSVEQEYNDSMHYERLMDVYRRALS